MQSSAEKLLDKPISFRCPGCVLLIHWSPEMSLCVLCLLAGVFFNSSLKLFCLLTCTHMINCFIHPTFAARTHQLNLFQLHFVHASFWLSSNCSSFSHPKISMQTPFFGGAIGAMKIAPWLFGTVCAGNKNYPVIYRDYDKQT